MKTKDILLENMVIIKEELLKQRLAVEASYRYATNLVFKGEMDRNLLIEQTRLKKQGEEIEGKIHYVLEVTKELKEDRLILEGLE